VSKDITGLARHAAIGALAWIHIARVQQPLAERTAPVGAENVGVRIGIQDPGLGPGQYQGLGPGQGTVIIMGGSQGHGQDPSRRNGAAHARTLSPNPVLAPGLARGRGRGRAIGKAIGASAHAGLAPEASRRVVAAAAVGNANGEEREVVRRMYVLVGWSAIIFNLRLQREKRERRKNGMASAAVGGQWGKYGIISESEYV
jgi:hypothetical protein